MHTVEQLLWQARDEISALAADTGIDGDALLHRLPAPGQLLTGAQVPTLERRYQGRCSVLFHVHYQCNGQPWPWLRFHTFKHGGIQRDFHGLHWLRRHGKGLNHQLQAPIRVAEPKSVASRPDWRPACFQRWQAHYQALPPLQPDHPWLIQRFLGQLGGSILTRGALRGDRRQVLMPLCHTNGQWSGFQALQFAPEAKKRFWLRHRGALAGSFGLLRGTAGPVALCEGLATGLSIALFWPGEIRIGLCANNLAAVRAGINRSVVYFADNDQWHSNGVNPGLTAALACQQEQDKVVIPHFAQAHWPKHPTDFNDLHRLEGLASLSQQVAHYWVSVR